MPHTKVKVFSIIFIMAGAYFTFVKNVEEYNRTRPAVEDMPLFNLKDE